MIWQDYLITAASIVFGLALIPQLHHGFKKKKGLIRLHTSIPTFVGCYAVAFAYFTLSLYYSATLSLIIGTLWVLLFIQKLIYRRNI